MKSSIWFDNSQPGIVHCTYQGVTADLQVAFDEKVEKSKKKKESVDKK